jgi:hypothetical protein
MQMLARSEEKIFLCPSSLVSQMQAMLYYIVTVIAIIHIYLQQ